MIVALVVLGAWAALADAHTRTIPNACVAATAVVGALFQLLRVAAPGVLALDWLAERLASRLAPPLACLLAAACVLALLVCAEFALRGRGQVGLGFGDAKLLAAWALVLGPVVAVAGAAALLAGALWAHARRRGSFAFAPWLSAACAAALFVLLIY